MNSALPKVLQPLAGLPLLSHVLTMARGLQPSHMIVVYGHGGEAVRARITEVDLAWAEQREQKGTGHALLQTLTHRSTADARMLVLYGDVPLLQPETLQRLLAGPAESLMLLTQTVEQPSGYGRILRDADGKVLGIREEKDANSAERRIHEINTGIMVIPGTKLETWLAQLDCRNAQEEYYLTDVVALAVADGVAVETVEPTHPWEALGVNDKSQLAQLEGIYQRHQAALLLQFGVTIIDPARLTLRGRVTCGRDVTLDVGVILEGTVVLGNGVTIGPYAMVRQSSVGDGTEIQAYSHVDGTQLGPQNRIGPYARIRPGTVTQEAVHIGNFVEVKNSSLGDHSKANHLTYIGDSQVGKRVNVGAGTITCNYDGVNKHKTIIGDDVFIGSDTQLVAPVTVEDGATIGAGSTIVRTAPQDKLTLSRTRQVTIEGWQRPTRKS